MSASFISFMKVLSSARSFGMVRGLPAAWWFGRTIPALKVSMPLVVAHLLLAI